MYPPGGATSALTSGKFTRAYYIYTLTRTPEMHTPRYTVVDTNGYGYVPVDAAPGNPFFFTSRKDAGHQSLPDSHVRASGFSSPARGDLVRSGRTVDPFREASDLSGDRVSSRLAQASLRCMCSRCAPCCDPRVRKYPAGRRPSSRRRRSSPPRARTVKYLWIAIRGFIGIGCIYAILGLV